MVYSVRRLLAYSARVFLGRHILRQCAVGLCLLHASVPATVKADGCCGASTIELDSTDVFPGGSIAVTITWIGNPDLYQNNKGAGAQLIRNSVVVSQDHRPSIGNSSQCGSRSVTLTLQVPADAEVTETLIVQGGLAYTSTSWTWYCLSSKNVNVVVTDARVDSNNDGVVDLSPPPETCTGVEDECLENDSALGKGLLVPVNNNDSNGDDLADYLDVGPNGVADESDFRALFINVPGGQDETELRLRVTPSNAAPFLRLYDPAGNLVLGNTALDAEGEPIGAPLSQMDIPTGSLGQGWLEFPIEGVAPGVVRIDVSFGFPSGVITESDIVKITTFETQAFFDADDDPDETVSGPPEVSVDDPAFPYVMTVGFVDEAGQEIPAANGSSVSWEVVSGTATLSASTSTTVGGAAGTIVTAPTTTGSTFSLKAGVTGVNIGSSSYVFDGLGGAYSPFEHSSPVVQVRAGRPDGVSVTFDAGSTFPASQTNQLSLTVSSQDVAGNVSPDGTHVTVDLEGTGGFDLDGDNTIDDTAVDLTLQSGSATITSVAGFASGSENVSVIVGEVQPSDTSDPVPDEDALESSVTIDQVPINITLTVSDSDGVNDGVIDIKSSEFFDVTATVLGTDGTAVADGTEIVWLSSLGSLSPTLQTPTGAIAVGTIQGGQASVRLYTYASDLMGTAIPGTAVAGTAQIIAAIGFSQARTSVDFLVPNPGAGPTPIQLEFEHRVLAGDETVDGVVDIDDLDFESRYGLMIAIGNQLGAPAADCPTCDLDGDGTVTLIDLIRARNAADPAAPTAPYYAQTLVTVRGDPNDVVGITASDPSLVNIIGLDGSGQVTLDALGEATITIQSLGALATDLAFVDITAVRVGAFLRGTPFDANQDEVRLVLIEQETDGNFYNFIAGAVWGGGEGAAAFTGDIILSICVLGDIRDLVKETAKLWPGGNDPSGLVFGLSLAGLGVTILPAVGGPLAVIKFIAKRVDKLIPNSSAAKFLGKDLKGLVGLAASDPAAFLVKFSEWRRFYFALARNTRFVQLIAKFSGRRLKMLQRVVGKLGESWAGHLVKVASDNAFAIGGKATIAGAKKVIKVMDKLAAVDQAAIDLIVRWAPGKQQKLARGLAATRGSVKWVEPAGQAGKYIWKGAIDDNVLRSLMDKDKINAVEELWGGFDEVIEELGKVAFNGTENANDFARGLDKRLVDYLNMPVQGNINRIRGHLNELKQMTSIVDGGTVKLVATNAKPLYPHVKNLDAVGKKLSDDVFQVYEFKHGASWGSPSGKQKKTLLNQMRYRAEMVTDPVHELFGARITFRLTGGTWGPTITSQLQKIANDKGVTLILE